MKRFKFAKLVRDKIVDSIKVAGNKPTWRTLNEREYLEELKKKILEEAKEIPNAKNKEELVGEIADLQEVVDVIKSLLGVSNKDVDEVRRLKNEKNGAFDLRHYIEFVETKDGSDWEEYYKKNSDKYPEEEIVKSSVDK